MTAPIAIYERACGRIYGMVGSGALLESVTEVPGPTREEIERRVSQAVLHRFGTQVIGPEAGSAYATGAYVAATYEDRVIFSRDGKMWECSYKLTEDDNIELSEPAPVYASFDKIAEAAGPCILKTRLPGLEWPFFIDDELKIAEWRGRIGFTEQIPSWLRDQTRALAEAIGVPGRTVVAFHPLANIKEGPGIYWGLSLYRDRDPAMVLIDPRADDLLEVASHELYHIAHPSADHEEVWRFAESFCDQLATGGLGGFWYGERPRVPLRLRLSGAA